MKDKLHKNYRIASNLMLLLLLVEAVDFFVSASMYGYQHGMVSRVIAFAFIALTAYAARHGVSWVKYVVLILALLNIAGLAILVVNSLLTLTILAIGSLQIILLGASTFLLFKIPPVDEQDALDRDI